MSAQRRKRLPTDFFDRLLSNETDNQLNDLLSSLVDEQVSPALETGQEEPSRPAVPAIAGGGYRKGIAQGKIEESIVTRDEELQEEAPVLDRESSWEELIPRTRQMQDQKIAPDDQAPEKPAASRQEIPAPQEALSPEVEEAEPPAGPEFKKFLEIKPEQTIPMIDLREQNQPEADLRTSEEIPAVEEENISKVSSTPPPGVHGAPKIPEIEEISWFPEVPLPPQDETLPGTAKVSGKAEEAGQVAKPPAGQAAKPPAEQAAKPPAEQAAKPPAEQAAKPLAGQAAKPLAGQAAKPLAEPTAAFLTHKELRRKRLQARWERPSRKPKLPKLAKAVPPIVPKPSKLAMLDDMWKPRPAGEWRRSMAGIHRAALFFLLPAFIAFSLFSWYPMLKGLMLSFLDYQPAGQSVFIGMDNYVRAFQDGMFWRTLGHAAGFCVLAIGMGFWIPIMLAIFINELRWGKGLLKFLFFLPFLMPTVPAAILWKWMMDQGFGLLNALVALLGVADPHIGWLTNPKLALLSLVLLYIWKNTGWAILIYSASLGNVDETIYEEAEIDGASVWDKLWHVTFPALRGVIAVMLIITVINTLQLFTEVYIMTNGGPMNSTEFIATYIYKQAFFNMDIGYASALSILLLIMLLFITVFRLRRLEPEGG